MHGQQSEERPRKRHMWPAPANGTVGDFSSNKFFSKDGRKISIGDCALFQAGNAPPFIGIIRCMTEDKEGQIKLGVNWLYRPADVKLGKGVVLEAAPNEVFYSFHKDEISAASLLHPCKVAFLRKGVELPAGVSSFVCRRVYDTTNRCLWWLTDQDYTDERQEEVDQLLDKTRQEMHAVIQSGGPSPKDLNGMSSTLKTGSDTAHNSSFPSQGKGKKRERVDHNTDPVKRERLSKSDGSETGHFKQDNSMRSEEIARITNKDGSLINSECVGQLVHLMQLDKNDATRKGIDLASWRKELVGVIATTDRDDWLSQFVQLKGLPILDDWLQEAHKGKTGDTGSPKESDKLIEELLLTLLHALGRLPVDLDALKTCNVGRSVNHLRNHKNMDIHKKARNLVDTWKKRVEKEMYNNDTKSGSSQGVTFPSKQASGEVSHAHGGRRGGPTELAKNSMPSTIKTISNRSGQTDILSRSTSVPSASTKVSPLPSSTISSKDSHCKEEKSSSSSQSQNNSQSWSSEPGKVAGSSWKEDARSSTAASMNAKGSSAGSRHRKSGNGMVGSSKAGPQKEAGGGKLATWSKNTCEKPLQSGQVSDRTIDNVRGDNANNHRLIVKLPNPGRSPAPCSNGGPIEDSVISASRVSSPIASDKHDANDAKIKVKTDVARASVVLEVNTESWQSNEVKDGVTECEDGDRSSTGIPSEDRSRIGEDIEKTPEISKTALSPSSCKLDNLTNCSLDAETDKTGEKIQTAVSVKSRSPLSRVTSIETDDVGMKLLANVAVSEPSKDEQVSTTGNSGRHEFVMVDGTLCGSTRKCSMDVPNSQPAENEDDKSNMDTKEVKDFPVLRGHQDASSNDLSAKFPTAFAHQKDGSDLSKHLEISASDIQEDSKHTSETPGAAPTSTDRIEQHHKSDQATNQSTKHMAIELSSISQRKTEEGLSTEKITKNDDEQQQQTHLETSNVELSMDKYTDNVADVQMVAVQEESGAIAADEDLTKPTNCIQDCHEGTTDYACPAGEVGKQEVLGAGKSTSHADAQSESLHLTVENDQMRDTELPNPKLMQNSGGKEDEPKDTDDNQHIPRTRSIANSDDSQETVTEKGEDMEVEKSVGAAGGEVDQMSHVTATIDRKTMEMNAASESNPNKDIGKDKFKEKGDVSIVPRGLPTSTAIPSSAILQEEKQIAESALSSPQEYESNAVEEIATEPLMPAKGDVGVSNTSGKLDFDLNEGFGIDETNQDDAMVLAASSSFVVPISNAPEMHMSNSSGPATPIAVAAKAKGPLMPPASPLRNKGEPGWKGSAATSAFRPAEPRKTPERQQATCEGPSDVLNSSVSGASGSQNRPHLNIDLNVADQGVVEDGLGILLPSRMKSLEFATANGIDFMLSTREPSAPARTASSGRLDLDLNRTEDCEESGPIATNTEVSSVKAFLNGFSHGESHSRRGFDLNDGPLVEDSVIEPTQWNSGMKSKGNPYLSSISGWGLNGEFSNIKSWLPSGNAPSLAIPSLQLDRNERSYPVVAAGATQHILNTAAVTPYGSDSYKGPVLSSSSAIAYPTPAQATFSYGAFSFGTNFPSTSTSFSGGPTPYMESSGTAFFPTIPSQLVSAGAVPSSGVRPYMMSLTDIPGTEASRKWPRPVLDLNTGPGTVELEVREDRVAPRQFSIADSQGSLEQQQSRAFYQTGVTPLKRKEPEPSWQ